MATINPHDKRVPYDRRRNLDVTSQIEPPTNINPFLKPQVKSPHTKKPLLPTPPMITLHDKRVHPDKRYDHDLTSPITTGFNPPAKESTSKIKSPLPNSSSMINPRADKSPEKDNRPPDLVRQIVALYSKPRPPVQGFTSKTPLLPTPEPEMISHRAADKLHNQDKYYSDQPPVLKAGYSGHVKVSSSKFKTPLLPTPLTTSPDHHPDKSPWEDKRRTNLDSNHVGTTPQLTPYLGQSRCVGFFRCHKCLHKWTSGHSWANQGQQCKRCNLLVYPYKQVKLSKEQVRQASKTPHDEKRCGKCQQLRHSCQEIA
ncbi:Zinc finger CCHC domain-containing protein 24 [Folsomia candida]|uniref:Zinc finger CCHC domain-containing protein 24 n=1 Tax=Folsomia candida TaxID=158441 RepID=A0A226CW87_FOLCA|nr:Zinc finger CCHC domain-containing protein 24 [Folsomia candida]